MRPTIVRGAGWGLVGTAMAIGNPALGLPHPLLAKQLVSVSLLAYATIGAVGGTVFAVALGLAERRAGGLDGLSIRRTAAWGAFGGVAMPLLGIARVMADPKEFWWLGLFAVLGAVSAAGSLALARRAPEQREQLGPPDADFRMSRHDAVEAPAARS